MSCFLRVAVHESDVSNLKVITLHPLKEIHCLIQNYSEPFHFTFKYWLIYKDIPEIPVPTAFSDSLAKKKKFLISFYSSFKIVSPSTLYDF